MEPEKLSGDSLLYEHLSDLVSVEHGDCSVAAAKANYDVTRLFNESPHQSMGELLSKYRGSQNLTLYPIGEKDHLYSEQAQVFTTAQNKIDIGEIVELVFARPFTVVEEPVEIPQPITENKRRLLGRKAVEASPPKIEIRETTRYQEPQFGALVGKDLYLPLGNFRYREDAGACSYIQLGTEMTDEDYYVVPEDEKGWRHKVVEMIRGLLQNESYREEAFEYEAMQQFIAAELSKYSELLLEKKEAQFVRRCLEKLDENGEAARRRVVDEEDGTIQKIDYQVVVPLSEGFLFGNSGRKVHFELIGESEGNGSSAYLCAVTRDDISIPLLNLSGKTASIGYPFIESKLNPYEKLKIINTLMEFVSNSKAVDILKFNDDEHTYDIDSLWAKDDPTQDFVISRTLNDIGALSDAEAMKTYPPKKYRRYFNGIYATGGPDKLSFNAKGKRLSTEITDHLKMLGREKVPYPDSKPLSLALFRMKKSIEIHSEIAEMFDIEDRLGNILGPTGPNQELLFEKILELAKDQQLRAVLRDVPLKTTRGDLEFDVRAKIEGGQGTLKVRSKPVGMPEDDRSEYISLVFDTKLPLFDHNSTSGYSAEQYAEIIYHLLKKIKANASDQ